jgi:hypothetical protein
VLDCPASVEIVPAEESVRLAEVAALPAALAPVATEVVLVPPPLDPPWTLGVLARSEAAVQAARARMNREPTTGGRRRTCTEGSGTEGEWDAVTQNTSQSQLSRRVETAIRPYIDSEMRPSSPRCPLRPLVALTLLLSLAVAGCRDAASSVPVPPPIADFVLSAGDSAFWVTSAGGSLNVRGAPLELARVNGRFYEIYVADDDRSYEDAVLVGQRIYRRDLISGDSLLVYEDTIVPHLAQLYARLHPDDVRIDPNDESSDDPLWRATTTIDLADLHGPFLSYTLHADVERNDEPLWHTSRRGVLDLATGREASLTSVVGGDDATVTQRRSEVVASTLDSVRTGGDRIDRRRTSALLHSYRLDPRSFVLTTVNGQPAVAYALSGQGADEAGHLLALPPIPIGEPAWWRDVAATFPISSSDGLRDVWGNGRYDVVVRYDSAGGPARLLLRDTTSREWLVGRVPAPAQRVFWLDQPPIDSIARRALARAFDESASYDEAVRSASNRARIPRPVARLARQRRAHARLRATRRPHA